MKIARLLGLALLAITALGSIAVTTASASDPEYKVLPSTKQFNADSGLTTYWGFNGRLYHCLQDHYVGWIWDRGQWRVIVQGLFCNTFGKEGQECTVKSVGAPKEGLVETALLTGLFGLVATSESATGVGVLLEPTTGHVFTTLEKTGAPCETLETAVEGSTAVEYSPINKLQATAKTIAVPSTSKGNKPKIALIKTEAGLIRPKLIIDAEQAAEEATEEITYAESVEVD